MANQCMLRHLGDAGKQAQLSCPYNQIFPIPDGCYLVSLLKHWNYTEIKKGIRPVDWHCVLFSKSCTENLTRSLGAGISGKKSNSQYFCTF